MSTTADEASAYYEKEKERHMRRIAQTVDEILVTLNAINRSQEITIDLAKQNLGEDGGAMNMWMHLRALGVQRARQLGPELGIVAPSQSQLQSQGTDAEQGH